MKRIYCLFTALTIAVMMFAADKATVCFTVNPNMVCQNCENKIKTNIRYEKGVKSIETSIDDQSVTIVYNPDKTNPEKIAKAFKKIGYTATVHPGTCVSPHKKCHYKANRHCGNRKNNDCNVTRTDCNDTKHHCPSTK